METIKEPIIVACWDFYGTLMRNRNDEVRDDGEEPYNARDLALESLAYLESQSIIQVTISDVNLEELIKDFKRIKIPVKFFMDFYTMPPNEPKSLQPVWEFFKASPQNLLVIVNDYKMDIELAEKQGCKTIYAPGDSALPLLEIKKIIEKYNQ